MSCHDPGLRRSIPLYEAGVLDPAESRRLEEHLLECPVCAEDLYDMQPVITAIGQMQSPFEEEMAPVSFRQFVRRHWIAVAATAAAAVIVLGMYLMYLPQLDWRATTPPTADINRILQDMARHVREGYPAQTGPADLQRAGIDYQAGNYAEAMAEARRLLDQGSADPAVILLVARCHLALGQPDQALARLTEHPVAPSEPSQVDFLWLQAEALLRLGRPEAARPLLVLLAARPGPYQAPARDILNLLPRPGTH